MNADRPAQASVSAQGATVREPAPPGAARRAGRTGWLAALLVLSAVLAAFMLWRLTAVVDAQRAKGQAVRAEAEASGAQRERCAGLTPEQRALADDCGAPARSLRTVPVGDVRLPG